MVFAVSLCRSPRLRPSLLYVARNTFSSKTNRNDTAHTMRDSYQQHSGHQYSAHKGCQDLLVSCMERLGRRMEFEDMYGMERPRRRVMADLGSADGSNSIRTLQIAVNALSNENPPLHVVFEEHPSSDRHLLQNTLDEQEDWFRAKNVTTSILMKSFYEPLFEPNSVDFCMSYICLHWLDTNDVTDIADWKTLDNPGSDNKNKKHLQEFVSVLEVHAPPTLREIWRQELANRHLANFFELRARELRPGAEMLLMMVGDDPPHEFLCPPKGGACPLTIAMQRCVQQGTLRDTVLETTLAPYFPRQPKDIRDALELAATLSPEYGGLLELVDLQTYQEVVATEDGSGTLDGACDLFWAIHGGCLVTAGATPEESLAVQSCMRDVFEELYDPSDEVRVTFLACVLRRRTRPRWNK
jgi:hypothetical protein